MADASRSSGVLTASKVISDTPCRLKSVHIACFAAGADVDTLKIFDSKDSTLTGNTEIYRAVFNGSMSADNIEADMHGVLAREGLFAQLTAPVSPDASSRFAFSVEFN